jgi:hypothetical protein
MVASKNAGIIYARILPISLLSFDIQDHQNIFAFKYVYSRFFKTCHVLMVVFIIDMLGFYLKMLYY